MKKRKLFFLEGRVVLSWGCHLVAGMWMCPSWELFPSSGGFLNQPPEFQGSSLSMWLWARMDLKEPVLGGNVQELVHLNSVQGVQ